jgi:hypothetical protein
MKKTIRVFINLFKINLSLLKLNFRSMYCFEINLNNKDYMKQNYLYGAFELAEILYILNFSIYFYIYCASGSVFRNQLKYSSML